MKKMIFLLVAFLFLFISCKPEVIEKEVEVVKEVEVEKKGDEEKSGKENIIPKSGTISIQISQPNDNGSSINLTNDLAPVNVKITGPDTITKVMWKKGTKDIGVKPATFFTNAHQITLDSNSSASFTVTENGWYDIVAQDSVGRYEWEQVEVKTIDKTPPANISNLTAEYATGYINLTWNEPEDVTGTYNSPFTKIKISYIYNNNSNDPDNKAILIPKGTGNYSIQRAAGKTVITYLDVKVQTVDEAGNESSGVSDQVECFETINTTTANAVSVITNLLYSAKVVVTGSSNDCNGSIENAVRSGDRKIALDMSGVTDYLYLSFNNCINLTDIVLPSGLLDISFENCTNLESIYNIPSSISLINCSQLQGSNKLKRVQFEDTNMEWKLYYNELGTNIYTIIKTIQNWSATDYESNANLLKDIPNTGHIYDYIFCNQNSQMWSVINQ